MPVTLVYLFARLKLKHTRTIVLHGNRSIVVFPYYASWVIPDAMVLCRENTTPFRYTDPCFLCQEAVYSRLCYSLPCHLLSLQSWNGKGLSSGPGVARCGPLQTSSLPASPARTHLTSRCFLHLHDCSVTRPRRSAWVTNPTSQNSLLPGWLTAGLMFRLLRKTTTLVCLSINRRPLNIHTLFVRSGSIRTSCSIPSMDYNYGSSKWTLTIQPKNKQTRVSPPSLPCCMVWKPLG